jgi:hypothetical protein
MKKKISITLSTDVRLKIDSLRGTSGSRSAFIEKVLSDHIKELAQREITASDLGRMNAAATRLNHEMEHPPGDRQ